MTYARRPSGFRAVQNYASIGLETQVLSASPERLITLLLAGARAAIAQARLHLEAGRTGPRGMAVSKAIRIVDEGLRTALDHRAGGELAGHLDQLYEFVVRTLLTANLNADDSKLTLADSLLANIEEAWQTSVDPRAAAA